MVRPRLSDAVVTALATEIIAGVLPVGTTLPPEPRLAARFEVSRTVVREATARLARQGLVAVRQGSGSVVRDRDDWNNLDPELLEIRIKSGLIGDIIPDLIAIRRIVEVELAGLAAERRTDCQLRDLRVLVETMEANIGQPEIFNDYDLTFHDALDVAAGNRLLRQMMEPVNRIRWAGSNVTLLVEPGIVRIALGHHWNIYRAVESMEADQARAAMLEHVVEFERVITESLNKIAQRSAEFVHGLPREGDST